MRRRQYLLLLALTVVAGLIGGALSNWLFVVRTVGAQETSVAAQEGQEPDRPKEIVGKDGAPMVLIPAGEFEMGTDLSEMPQLAQWAKKWYFGPQASWFESEAPRHAVYLDKFHMDKYEVTNALYRKFMDATGHRAPKFWDDSRFNVPDHPVVGVSWDDAKSYAEWAGKRLPTEAQWEKAARGGLAGKRFPWGDSDPDGSQCNFSDKNTDEDWSDKSVDDGYAYSAPVGSFTPNGYRLYDMAGNVWEWCGDWYDRSYYANSPESNPTGPSTATPRGKRRAVRGGSWYGYLDSLRVANRGGIPRLSARKDYGFRCVSQD